MPAGSKKVMGKKTSIHAMGDDKKFPGKRGGVHALARQSPPTIDEVALPRLQIPDHRPPNVQPPANTNTDTESSNPIGDLNEMVQGGNIADSTCTHSVGVDGQTTVMVTVRPVGGDDRDVKLFVATARNRKLAKREASQQALAHALTIRVDKPVPGPQVRRSTADKTEHVCHCGNTPAQHSDRSGRSFFVCMKSDFNLAHRHLGYPATYYTTTGIPTCNFHSRGERHGTGAAGAQEITTDNGDQRTTTGTSVKGVNDNATNKRTTNHNHGNNNFTVDYAVNKQKKHEAQ